MDEGERKWMEMERKKGGNCKKRKQKDERQIENETLGRIIKDKEKSDMI